MTTNPVLLGRNAVVRIGGAIPLVTTPGASRNSPIDLNAWALTTALTRDVKDVSITLENTTADITGKSLNPFAYPSPEFVIVNTQAIISFSTPYYDVADSSRAPFTLLKSAIEGTLIGLMFLDGPNDPGTGVMGNFHLTVDKSEDIRGLQWTTFEARSTRFFDYTTIPLS